MKRDNPRPKQTEALQQFLLDALGRKAGDPAISLGQLALDRGLINKDQILDCIREQHRLADKGKKARLGQLLVKKGYLQSRQLAELLKLQKQPLRVCMGCGRVQKSGGRKGLCEACGSALPADKSGTTSIGSGERLGRYVLKRIIGRGGMSTVFEAHDDSLDRTVALKVLWEERADPMVITRLHREAKLAGQLEHPNIVAVHEIGTEVSESGHNAHFISMDFIEGVTWSELLHKKKIPMEEHLSILHDMCRAVGFAHSKGVVHRDLKPENVLVDRRGRPLLTDFGLAYAESAGTRITRLDSRMGTPLYMAPEQVRGRTVNARTDIYGLGAILYEILTGTPPFTGTNPLEVYEKIMNEEPVRPRDSRPGTPEALELVCLTAMHKDMDRRYATADEMADDLDRHQRGETIAGLGTSSQKKGGRRSWTAPLLLIPVILGVLAWFLVPGLLKPKDPGEDPVAVAAARERAKTAVEEGTALMEGLDGVLSDSDATMEMTQEVADKTWSAFNRALKEVPEYPPALIGIARTYRMEGKFAKSLDYGSEAARLAPEEVDIRLEVAVLRLELLHILKFDPLGRPGPTTAVITGIVTSAQADLKFLEMKKPESPDYALARGLAALLAKKYAESIRHMKKHGGARSWYWHGLALMLQGMTAEAEPILTKAVNNRPRNLVFRCLRGSARQMSGDDRGARSDFEMVLRLAPNDWRWRKKIEEQLR